MSLVYECVHKFRDRNNCVREFKGGWWYRGCHRVNFNGLYWNHPQALRTPSEATGLTWKCYKGYHYSFKRVEILIVIDANDFHKLAA